MANVRYTGGAGRTALAAVLTALSLLFLYLSNFLPTGRMVLVAVAGLIPAAAVISSGLGTCLLCYIATGLLGLLLSPDKGTVLLYLLFFGIYPIVKHRIERLRRLPLEIFCKLVFFNGVLSLFWFGLNRIFLPFLPTTLTKLWMVYLVGNVVFFVYDLGFSKLIAFYTQRIDKAVHRG